MGILIAYVVYSRLLRIVESVGKGEPFSVENAGRVRTVAWALPGLELLHVCVVTIASAVSSAPGWYAEAFTRRVRGMAESLDQPGSSGGEGHARWVRISHWIVTLSVLTLAFSGFEILMVHPRLYWGKAGNDLTPALVELPISRNYKHGGYDRPVPLTDSAAGPVSANRTYDIFNQNSWGRSLHFLAAWFLILPGLVYLLLGLSSGHFRSHIWPRIRELSPRLVWRDMVAHLRFRIPAATGGPRYGLLQKCAYSFVVFVAAPLMVGTGLTMSPAVTAAFPDLLDLFGGYQSARTIHFFASAVLVLFVIAHVVMVVRSGFRRHMRAMTLGR